jgi:dienelactone hydrolase
LVRFETAPYVLGQFQQRRAIEHGEMAVATTSSIEGYLAKPDGEGPFPAIIYLHGCHGLGKGARKRFSDLFTGWGYVSLAVDSFATRGIEEACDRPMPDRQADAWDRCSTSRSSPSSTASGLPSSDHRRAAL